MRWSKCLRPITDENVTGGCTKVRCAAWNMIVPVVFHFTFPELVELTWGASI
jgi:hypothetical protein